MDDHSNKPTDDRLEAGRAILRESLDQIVADVRTALRDVGLSYPVHVRVQNSGDALATLITSANPPQGDWEKATMIFLEIIGGHLGEVKLRSRDRKLSHDWCRRDL
jgi:hypothetical protein